MISREFKPCEKCANKENLFKEGFLQSVDSNNNLVVRECDCHRQWRGYNQILTKFKKCGGNPLLFNLEFSDYKEPIPDRFSKFAKQYFSNLSNPKIKSSFVWFYGDNGTQKTTMGNLFLKRLLINRVSSSFILMNSLAKLLMNAERDEVARKELEILSSKEVLIIDESFDISKMSLYKSGWQIPFLDTFLRERIAEGKGVIFISNVDVPDIDDRFGKSLKDLITRTTTLLNSRIEFKNRYLDSFSIIPEGGLFD